jgi:iron-sulfur cluster repair protein YtfE (RIC family)
MPSLHSFAHLMPGSGSDENSGVFERWWQEHSELDQLVSELEAALHTESNARASQALEELSEALRSHLAVEEDVYFPLLERLLPDSATGVQSARLAHRHLLVDLEKLREDLTQPDLTGARSTLEKLLRGFREHEQAEAEMVARLRSEPSS